MQALSSRVLVVILVEHVAHLIIFIVLIEQIWLFHDRVAHRNVRVLNRRVEHVTAYSPEVHSFFKSFHQLELLLFNQVLLDLGSVKLAALLDKSFTRHKLSHILMSALWMKGTKIIVIEIIDIVSVDDIFFHELFQDFRSEFVLELRCLRFLHKVLAHDLNVLIEFTRTVHCLHVLLDGGTRLDLGIVCVVLEVSEALRIPSDPLLLPHVSLVHVFLIHTEFI